MVFDKLSMEENSKRSLCGECSLRCLDLHPSILLDSNGFSFFKVMGKDFTSCLKISIPIPMPFKFEENEELHVVLIGQSGQLWTVKACVGDDGLVVLRNGWEVFVSNNSLSVGDVVVFNHIFSTQFVVQVFGSNGLEKQSRRVDSKSCIQGSGCWGNSKQIVKVVSKKRKKHAGAEEEELKYKSELVKVGFQETVEMAATVSSLSSYHTPKTNMLKKTSALVETQKHERAGEEELKSKYALVETQKHERAGEEELKSKYALVEIGFQETVEMAAKVSGLSSYHTPKTKKLKKTSQTEHALVPVNAKMSRLTFASELSKILANAKYPNFVKLLKDSAVGSRCRLSLPKEYRETWLKSINEVILTKNNDHSYSWKQEILSYNRFYGFQYGGWKSFVQAHNLKTQDICVFELVDTNHLKVYILKLEDQWRLEP